MASRAAEWDTYGHDLILPLSCFGPKNRSLSSTERIAA
jgi:hypothetical protein